MRTKEWMIEWKYYKEKEKRGYEENQLEKKKKKTSKKKENSRKKMQEKKKNRKGEKDKKGPCQMKKRKG